MDDFKNIQPGDLIQTADHAVTGVVVQRVPVAVTGRPSLQVQRHNRKPALVAVDDVVTVWRRERVPTVV